MTTASLEQDVELVCGLVKSKMQEGARTIVGVVGLPASAVVHQNKIQDT